MPAVQSSLRQRRQRRYFAHRFSPAHSNGSTMKDAKDKGEGQSGARAKNPRRDRLKLALRENLKRRKTQAGGRNEVKTGPPKPDEGSPHYNWGVKKEEKRVVGRLRCFVAVLGVGAGW